MHRRDLAVRVLVYRATQVILAAVAFVAVSGCDESFAPIAETDLRLSLFGYLDASADTQWVRVTTIRPTVPSGPSPIPARVTLEELESATVVELRDSLFRYDIGEEVGSEGFFLHNFWTTEPIRPGATYRLTAAPTDGSAVVEATIQIPDEYEVEVWLAQSWTDEGDFLRIEGLPYLGVLWQTNTFRDACGETVRRSPIESDGSITNSHRVRISARVLPRDGCGRPEVEWRELFVVGSALKWPEGDALNTGNLNVPSGLSNVEGGLGFIGGVLTRTVPYENCLLERLPEGGNHCVVRYDDDAAGLSGRVVDVACEGEGVTAAAVELQELTPSPTGRRRRWANTDGHGDFRIEGLDPQQRYALTVRRFIRDDPFDQFREYRDTLTFSAGEHRRYDVPFERYLCPP